MTTVGEPMRGPRLALVLRERRQGRRPSSVDTWWQTETRRFLGAPPLPGIDPAKRAPAARPRSAFLPGSILDRGRTRCRPAAARRPHIGIPQPVAGRLPDDLGPAGPVRLDVLRQVHYNNPESTDWHDWPYFAGDGATGADGYFRILGGSTTWINVAATGSAPRSSSRSRSR